MFTYLYIKINTTELVQNSKDNKPSKTKNSVSISDTTDKASISKLNSKRQIPLSTPVLIERLVSGDRAALSRAITLVESQKSEHRKQANTIVQHCLKYSGKSIRIGITGVPGVGKSTFIESLGSHIIQQGNRLAVLAVDPSSTLTKGSILGDKTRMETLVGKSDAFIRPTASGVALGGVAQHTRETTILCEAAGYNVILIETVGVGQNETTVHSMVDFFLLLKLAGAGDELQGIKRGIIEMADAIVINKSDGDNIERSNLARIEFDRALHLYPPKPSKWTPIVKQCSALEHRGITELWELISTYAELTTTNGFFRDNRQKQNQHWMLQTIETSLKNNFFSQPEVQKAMKEQLEQIYSNTISPFSAAQNVLNIIKSSG